MANTRQVILNRQSAIGAALGAMFGVGAGVLPLPVALVGIGGLVISVLAIIQPAGLLVGTLVIAPLKTLIDTQLPGWPDIGQIAFALTVAAWLVHRIALRKSLFVWSIVYVPLALIILSASLSLFVSIAPQTTLAELAKWVELLIAATLVATICLEDRSVRWPAIGVLAMAGAQAAIGIYQFFGGSGAPNLWILNNQYFRAFGTFGQPNPFGASLGLALPLAIGWLYARIQNKSRRFDAGSWASLGLIALLVAGLIASWSRGAWAGAAAAIGVMIVLAPRRRAIGFAIGGGAVLIGGAVAISGVLPASLQARIGDFTADLSGFQDVRGQVITDANYAVLERLAHWQAGLAMADAHPWLGVGFGAYEAAYPDYRLMNWPFPLGHAHNYYINLLAETGIVGAIGYIVAWLIIIWLTLKALGRLSGAMHGLALGLLGAWTYLAVHSLFDKLYVNNLYLHVGALVGILGGLLLLSRPTGGDQTGYNLPQERTLT